MRRARASIFASLNLKSEQKAAATQGGDSRAADSWRLSPGAAKGAGDDCDVARVDWGAEELRTEFGELQCW